MAACRRPASASWRRTSRLPRASACKAWSWCAPCRGRAPRAPAERAGMRGVNEGSRNLGDVIVGVNGKPVRRLSDLTDELELVGVGKSVDIALNRGGTKSSLTVNVTDVAPPR